MCGVSGVESNSSDAELTCRLEQSFKSLCAPGQNDIDGRGFITLCKKQTLFDEQFTPADAEIVFNKTLPLARRRMDIWHLREALRLVAGHKSLHEAQVHEAVLGFYASEWPAMSQLHRGTNTGKMRSSAMVSANNAQGSSSESMLPLEAVQSSSGEQYSSTEILVWTSHKHEFEQDDGHTLASDISVSHHRPTLLGRRGQELAGSEKTDTDQALAAYATHTSSSFASTIAPQTDTQALDRIHEQRPHTSIKQASEMKCPSNMEQLFELLCGSQGHLDIKAFVKLCKRSCLLDRKTLTSKDARLIFSHAVPLGSEGMDLTALEAALSSIAEKRSLDLALVRQMVKWSQSSSSSDNGRCCDGDGDSSQLTWPLQSQPRIAQEAALAYDMASPSLPLPQLPASYASSSFSSGGGMSAGRVRRSFSAACLQEVGAARPPSRHAHPSTSRKVKDTEKRAGHSWLDTQNLPAE